MQFLRQITHGLISTFTKIFSKVLNDNRRGELGFTMIELVMVIVILGILGSAGADFISQAFKGMSDTDARMELYEEGKIILVRLEREIHHALPNAVIVQNEVTCQPGLLCGPAFHFAMIAEDSMKSIGLIGRYKETAISFPTDKLEDESGLPASVGSLLSVYNVSWNDFAGGGRVYQVDGVAGAVMDLDTVIAATGSSPQQRFYLVDPRVIGYEWSSADSILYRMIDTVTTTGAGDFSTSTRIPAATDVTACEFYYSPATLSRNGILSVKFTLTKKGQQMDFHKAIHVKNVP